MGIGEQARTNAASPVPNNILPMGELLLTSVNHKVCIISPTMVTLRDRYSTLLLQAGLPPA